jgi:hypothetical protein
MMLFDKIITLSVSIRRPLVPHNPETIQYIYNVKQKTSCCITSFCSRQQFQSHKLLFTEPNVKTRAAMRNFLQKATQPSAQNVKNVGFNKIISAGRAAMQNA